MYIQSKFCSFSLVLTLLTTPAMAQIAEVPPLSTIFDITSGKSGESNTYTFYLSNTFIGKPGQFLVKKKPVCNVAFTLNAAELTTNEQFGVWNIVLAAGDVASATVLFPGDTSMNIISTAKLDVTGFIRSGKCNFVGTFRHADTNGNTTTTGRTINPPFMFGAGGVELV